MDQRVHQYSEFVIIIRLGHRVTVLHYSSIEDATNTAFTTRHPSLRFVDFKYYRYSIESAIAEKCPNVALFLSIDPLIMRAISLALNRRNIPSVVLYPGLWSTQDLSSKKHPLLIFCDVIRKLNDRLSQYLFALRHYFYQVWLSSRLLKLLVNFFRVEVHKLCSKPQSLP